MVTTYFMNVVAGNVFKCKTDPPLPEKMFLGVSSTEPNLDGSGVTEPSAAAGYKRKAIAGLGEPTNGVVRNKQIIELDESTDDWGVMRYWVVYDSDSIEGGNLLAYGPFERQRTVEGRTTMTVGVGELDLGVVNVSASGEIL